MVTRDNVLSSSRDLWCGGVYSKCISIYSICDVGKVKVLEVVVIENGGW